MSRRLKAEYNKEPWRTWAGVDGRDVSARDLALYNEITEEIPDTPPKPEPFVAEVNGALKICEPTELRPAKPGQTFLDDSGLVCGGVLYASEPVWHLNLHDLPPRIMDPELAKKYHIKGDRPVRFPKGPWLRCEGKFVAEPKETPDRTYLGFRWQLEEIPVEKKKPVTDARVLLAMVAATLGKANQPTISMCIQKVLEQTKGGEW
jgi:hypothetical protein